jgi:hypothetical protein
MPTIYVRFRLHFGRQSLDHGDGIDRAVDVRNLCRAIVDGLCMLHLLKAGWVNCVPRAMSAARTRRSSLGTRSTLCAKNGPEQVQQGGSGKVESLRSECGMASPPFTPTSAPSKPTSRRCWARRWAN